MLDLETVVERVANAMGGVEERDGTEHKKIETHERKLQHVDGAGILYGLQQVEWNRNPEDEQVDGNQKSSDDTAGAEEDPQERFDAKFGRLSVHFKLATEATRWPPQSRTTPQN